jgi:hypothetical protein
MRFLHFLLTQKYDNSQRLEKLLLNLFTILEMFIDYKNVIYSGSQVVVSVNLLVSDALEKKSWILASERVRSLTQFLVFGMVYRL